MRFFLFVCFFVKNNFHICLFQNLTPTPSVKKAMRRCGTTGRLPDKCADHNFPCMLWHFTSDRHRFVLSLPTIQNDAHQKWNDCISKAVIEDVKLSLCFICIASYAAQPSLFFSSFFTRKRHLCCLGDVPRKRWRALWKRRGRGFLLLRQWLILWMINLNILFLKRVLFLISNNVNGTEERCHVNNKIAVLLPRKIFNASECFWSL